MFSILRPPLISLYSQTGFGVTFAGEFSTGYNDCGLFLRGVGNGALYGDCTLWQDASNWNDTVKAGLQAFTEASMDALGDWFFWTWKIGNSTAGIVEAPLWSYKAGFEGGWIPQDPRKAKGKCAQAGVNLPTFDGTYQPWQTGGGGGGQIAASATQDFPWPPPSISGIAGGDVAAAASLPTYTPTGTVATLPPPTFTDAPSASVENGWADPSDTSSAYTAIDGCTYPNAWEASTVPVPASLCGAAAPTAR
jgi:glucan 1,3-beta-glucosidase